MTIRHDDAELPRIETSLPPLLPDRDLPRLPPPTAPEPMTTPMFGQATLPQPAARPVATRKRRSHGARRILLVLAILAAGGGAYLAFAERGDPETDDSAPLVTSIPMSNIVDGTSTSVTGVQDELGEAYIGPLTFGWSAGCTVPVSETVTKRGSTATLTYALSIDADPAGLLISFVDMTVVTIDGEALPPGAAQQAVAVFRLPSFVVDHHGAVVDVRGTEELVDQMVGLVPEMGEMDRGNFVAILEDSIASKYWDSWAGFWSAYGSVDELRYETTVDMPFGGVTIETHSVVESLGTTTAGDALLRTQQISEGDDLLVAMGASFAELGVDGPGALTTARRVITIDATTDPDTLRPRTVSMSIDFELGDGVESARAVEMRDWTFDWSAPGCGG